MSFPVVDASFAIKWLLPEKGSNAALSVLDRIQCFVVPDLFIIETDSIVTKKVRRRELKPQEAPILQEKIRQFPYLVIPYKRICDFTLELSTSLAISHYDACYLAVSIHFGGTLYTADLRMSNGLSTTPFAENVCSIEEI